MFSATVKGKILSIQNIEFETLGSLEELIQSDGYEIENIEAQTEPLPQNTGDYTAIIILGGPMAVYDNLGYIVKEQDLIRDAIKNKVPVLGICLGSQLIAQAAGGNVYKGSKKEIGWYNVTLNHNGQNDLFKDIKSKTMRVFQWHGDTYDLPSTATIMASSELYPQAFRIGTAVGIQFHLEINYKMIERWIHEYRQELNNENIKPENILSDTKDIEDLYDKCKVVYSNFSKLIMK
ncbi:MAG TPA: type 1 glutamine amidotransferase [Nitrososphaeraceae archaeon]|nr:type 1 glutamine amidotransferase [Nitrososphaeraceae archaeon]